MFLHSGASLHGHEYSNRPSPPAGQHAAQRRNPLLRSAFATPINRASTYSDSRSPPTTAKTATATTPSLKRVRTLSAYSPETPDSVVRFREPEYDFVSAEPTAMSEDEGSLVDISDSDASHAASSTRRRRRRAPRQCTSYLLAQPPPKLGTRQRLLHIRPKLLLQMQQLSAGQRPRPAIDVYPSSGIANTAIAAHLCKRFPRLGRMRREESIQDVMLMKSDDYDSPAVESDSDGDDDGINKRDLVAILSPLPGQDKAEIVLADGTVWVASPRINGTCCSYEFTTVDETGHTTTARWVRRQVTKSPPPTMPATPTSDAPALSLNTAHSASDYKFTFSIIDPACRRHPIMATLNPTSLEISDTYTTVSQSAGRYPPTSQALASPTNSTSEDGAPSDRTTRAVEEWQRLFIQVSSLWVALRHGWVPNFNPTDFIPQSASSNQQPIVPPPTRNLSFKSAEAALKTLSRDLSVRRSVPPQALGEPNAVDAGSRILPRRATSTGAARMQRLRSQQKSPTPLSGSEAGSIERTGRRALSGDWNTTIANRFKEDSWARVVDPKRPVLSQELSMPNPSVPPLVSTSFPTNRRVVSEYYPPNPMLSTSEDDAPATDLLYELPPNPLRQGIESMGTDEADGRRHHRWRSVTNWFSKLRVH
jgi:hypothetical protein